MKFKNYKISFNNIKLLPICFNILLISFLIFHFYTFNGNKLFLHDFLVIFIVTLIIFLVVFVKYEKIEDNEFYLLQQNYFENNEKILYLDENKEKYCEVKFQINNEKPIVLRTIPQSNSIIYKFQLEQALFFSSKNETLTLKLTKINGVISFIAVFTTIYLPKVSDIYVIKTFKNDFHNELKIEINKDKFFEFNNGINKFKIWFDIESELKFQKEITV